jgi:hypothetical protein
MLCDVDVATAPSNTTTAGRVWCLVLRLHCKSCTRELPSYRLAQSGRTFQSFQGISALHHHTTNNIHLLQRERRNALSIVQYCTRMSQRARYSTALATRRIRTQLYPAPQYLVRYAIHSFCDATTVQDPPAIGVRTVYGQIKG